MKEAFWGVLIVSLGIFGIVAVNLFQTVTVDNDRVYYVLKESTEASAYDAIDLTYYRLTGNLRIVEDKFAENIARRFAENITMGDYKIIIADINEMPPKVSLWVRSGITSLQGEKFELVNAVNGILETKYTFEDIEDYVGVTEEEWINIKDVDVYEKEEDETICDEIVTEDEMECIPGDIKFTGWGSVLLEESICDTDTPKKNVEREAKYKVCDCGKWSEEKVDKIYANPVTNYMNRTHNYTWTFNKKGDIREINETVTETVRIDVCTTAIEEWIPKDIEEVQPNKDGTSYEPSTDNSEYVVCPKEGIKIPIGFKFTMHPNYIPKESVNRSLIWTSTDNSVINISSTNPLKSCVLNSTYTNCLSKAVITANKVGTAYVNVKTTRDQTASCKIEVFDGKVDSIGCEDLKLNVGSSGVIVALPNPKNATILNYEYDTSNSKIASISGNTIVANASGTVTITIKETNTGKTGTCIVNIPSPPDPPRDYGGDYKSGSSSGGYWKVTDANGKITFYPNYEKAQEAARAVSGLGTSTISYKNSGTNNREVKYSTVNGKASGSQSVFNENIYNGNLTAQKQITVSNNSKYSQTVETDLKTGKQQVTDYVYHNSSSGRTSNSSSSSSSKKPSSSSSKPSRGTSSSGSGHKRPSTGGCFPEKTSIITIDGYKNIEDIEIGDIVLSYNTETKKTEYKEVLKLFVHENYENYMYELTINGKVLKVTGEHRIYIKNNYGINGEWIEVKDLKVGDKLMDKDNDIYMISLIKRYKYNNTVYNFEVEDNHNYYVTTDNYLVHNRKSMT